MRIKPKPKKQYLNFLFNRLLSVAMVMSIGFLLLVSLFVDALLAVFSNYLTQIASDYEFTFITIANVIFSLAVITFIFAMIFNILPDARIKWRDVWIGAFVTTLLFVMGKFLIGIYLGNSSIGNAYGAAGSLVLLLLWVYYSALILLFGAEFTYVYSQEIGDNIRPNKNAVFIKIKEQEVGTSAESA